MEETIYDKELISFIEDKGLSNKIIINECTDEFIEDIEKNFVMGFNGIDWDQNRIIYSKKMDLNLNNYLEEARFFLEDIKIKFPYLLNERIVIIGDSLTNLSYEMIFNIFLKEFEEFLTIPQHTYIWFIESKKCINFSFENEIFFG